MWKSRRSNSRQIPFDALEEGGRVGSGGVLVGLYLVSKNEKKKEKKEKEKEEKNKKKGGKKGIESKIR